MKLISVDFIFYYQNDKEEQIKITAQFTPAIGWQQWGASKEELSENVELIEALKNTIIENADLATEE